MSQKMSQTTSDPRPAARPTPWPARLRGSLANLLGLLADLRGALSRLAHELYHPMPPVDVAAVLDRLPPVEVRAAADDDRLFEQASIAKVLLLMVEVNQESEYRLCRDLAEHALGPLSEPGAPLGLA